MQARQKSGRNVAVLVLTATGALSQAVFGQASPFQTGADSFVTNFVAIATPIAVILVMALGIAAMIGRVSWGWPVAALAGIAIMFGAPQIVEWTRGMFAV